MLKLQHSHHPFEAGTDEAGRGCLAGPVTAAAVILPAYFTNELLNDSKQLSEKKRESLKKVIEKEAISFKVIHLDHEVVDEINILNASIKAMQECIIKLNPTPDYIVIDGNRFKSINNIPFSCIIKGDGKYMNIAAASILAKTYRDEYMNTIHEEFPMYNWKKNKGYPTVEHREAIKKFGPCRYHRKTFRLLADEQLELKF